MNVCIGGPWHGSKVLKCPSRKGWFSVKDSSGNAITYHKKEIKIGSRVYIFWIDSNLTVLESDVMIDNILYSRTAYSKDVYVRAYGIVE